MDLFFFENQNIQKEMSNNPFYHRKSQKIIIYLMKIKGNLPLILSRCPTKNSIIKGT